MSNLNPGGSRSRDNRVFGASSIARACDANRTIPGVDAPCTSIADKPHQHSREAQRRLRQEAAREAKRTRAIQSAGDDHSIFQPDHGR